MWFRTAAGVLALGVVAGCAAPVQMAVSPHPQASCRATPPDAAANAITWIGPDDGRERRALDQRCAQVGLPIVEAAPQPLTTTAPRLVVATWNMHDGRGDVLALVEALRRGTPNRPPPDAVIVLLQEVVRAIAVPSRAAATPAPSRATTGVRDVPSIVKPLGWHFAYIPGKRNRLRPAGATAADRGIAILSTLPLSQIEAIELPVERQRRVALSAVVSGTARERPWRLRVVSVHLENRSGSRRVWARAGASRTRQTEALLQALALSPTAGMTALPMLVGGDFNTWLGEREDTLRLLHGRFGRWSGEDHRQTIGVRRWRLDYLFPLLPTTVAATHRRLDSMYGSDHYPVVAEIDFGAT